MIMEDTAKVGAEDPISINAGGEIFSAYRNTLCKQPDSRLAQMIDGRLQIPIHRGLPFIPTNKRYFAMIMDFLQYGQMPLDFHSPTDREMFMKQFFSLGLEVHFPFAKPQDKGIIPPTLYPEISTWFPQRNVQLLLRGSIHGFGSDAFHERCDHQGPTVVFIRTTNRSLFGGYTEVSWTKDGAYHIDPSSFVFGLKWTGTPISVLPTRGNQSCVSQQRVWAHFWISTRSLCGESVQCKSRQLFQSGDRVHSPRPRVHASLGDTELQRG
eukprot:gnl/Trimastix_PCT/4678.p1 GENE.gnl/Trimastix_PCT/4678~~gnl/Trimastix_PCT/4678.p1  ORF type:complete len:268 (-),score=1.91 gnl/Trimastix_PCT/4678:38-841(-)